MPAGRLLPCGLEVLALLGVWSPELPFSGLLLCWVWLGGFTLLVVVSPRGVQGAW